MACSLHRRPRGDLLVHHGYHKLKSEAYHDVNVGRAHRMPVEQVEDDTSRAISGERVCCWAQAVEVVFTILVGSELSTKVVVFLVVRVLEII